MIEIKAISPSHLRAAQHADAPQIESEMKFRENVKKSFEQELGNFIWSSLLYCADKTGKIFFATSHFGLHKWDVQRGSKATFYTQCIYYDVRSTDEVLEKIYPSCRDLFDLKAFLASKDIKELASHQISSDSTDHKCEILDCVNFVAYVLTKELNEYKSDNNQSFREMQARISTLIREYFPKPLNLPEANFSDNSLKVGDLLYFWHNEDCGARQPIGRHVGFFCGYNSKQQPLICDLWNRNNSFSVQIVDFMNSYEYLKHGFKIHYFDLKHLLEMVQNQPGLQQSPRQPQQDNDGNKITI